MLNGEHSLVIQTLVMTNLQAGSSGRRDGGIEPIDLTDSERTLNEANSRHRVSWPGVFAGLVAGIALSFTAVGITWTLVAVTCGAAALLTARDAQDTGRRRGQA